MPTKISVHTSVEDLTSSLKCGFNGATVRDFQNAIHKEKIYLNRKSVIAVLTRAMNYRKMGRKSLSDK